MRLRLPLCLLPLTILLATPIFSADITDEDGDGMSDVWQRLYSIPFEDWFSDPDTDSFPNVIEARAGTNPRDNLSRPVATPPDTTSATGGTVTSVAFTWKTEKGKNYHLQYANPTQLLPTGAYDWQVLKDSSNRDRNFTGTGFNRTYTFTNLPDAPAYIFRARTRQTENDADEDGLTDWEETLTGTSSTKTDTDGDGLHDDWEWKYEFTNGTDESLADADNDGLPNLAEFLFGYDPRNPDTDGDTIGDLAEFNTTYAALDADNDGLTNGTEIFTHQTHPKSVDTELDGLLDGWEIAYGLNPKNGTGNNGPDGDPDGDGLKNIDEMYNGTSPNNSDSDNDGVNDNVEVDQGSDPNDPNDKNPPPDGTAAVILTFGDGSTSESEKYKVTLTALEGDTVAERYRTNRSFGSVENYTMRLPRGGKWKITMSHVGTSPKYRGTPNPDLDFSIAVKSDTDIIAKYDPNTNPTWLDNSHKSEDAGALSKEAFLSVPSFEWITPAKSPVTEPDDTGEGQNEYTYSTAATGDFTMNLKVKVQPAGVAAWLDQKCTFEVPAIGESLLSWQGTTGNGDAIANGDYLTANVTYSGLPSSNSSFGLKQAKLGQSGKFIPHSDFEVFYSKNAANHPNGGLNPAPNWFYYWKDALGYTGIEYKVGNQLYGEVPGMSRWSYTTPQDKSVVYIYDLAALIDPGETNADGGKKATSGIDTFVDTVIHEKKHVAQIQLADQLVAISPDSPWRYGWSWGKDITHNHWNLGSDGKPGVMGVDDDGDGNIDNLLVSSTGELGYGDDMLLGNSTYIDWPIAWGALPPLPWAGNLAIEDQAYNIEPDAEHAQAAKDWGSPGKQHKTLNKYND